MIQSKIIIEITDSHEPPKVSVDGKEVKVIALDYFYNTNTHHETGEHKMNLVMPDVINGIFQTKGIAFEKNKLTKKTT